MASLSVRDAASLASPSTGCAMAGAAAGGAEGASAEAAGGKDEAAAGAGGEGTFKGAERFAGTGRKEGEGTRRG